MRAIFYQGGCSFKEHYIFDILTGKFTEVEEEQFFRFVGYDRSVIPMKYDKDNVNIQNFYLNGALLGYRVR